MAADIDMKTKGEETKKDETSTTESPEPKPPVPQSPASLIKANVSLIERAVSTLEPRFTHRVLRSLTSLRKRLDWKVLKEAIEGVYPPGEQPAFVNTRHYSPNDPCNSF